MAREPLPSAPPLCLRFGSTLSCREPASTSHPSISSAVGKPQASCRTQSVVGDARVGLARAHGAIRASELTSAGGYAIMPRHYQERAHMPFIDRIGIDVGCKLPAEDAIAWAGRHGVKAIDVQTDIAPNALESFDDARCKRVLDACSSTGVSIALHTLSAVNVAEVSPILRDATDQYLAAYVALAARLRAKWVIVHGGYNFTSDAAMRKAAALARLARTVKLAEKSGVQLLLENLNGEPERAEVHYMPDTLEETQDFLRQLSSPNLKWSFTINHAHYDSLGIKGWVERMDMQLCGEVRVADNNGLYEIHMHPGTGTVDFLEMFRLIEGAGYRGPYTCGWGTIEQMLDGRKYLADKARAAGVA